MRVKQTRLLRGETCPRRAGVAVMRLQKRTGLFAKQTSSDLAVHAQRTRTKAAQTSFGII